MISVLSFGALIALICLITFGANAQNVQVFQGHEFQLFTDPLNWVDASEACQLWGGHLASITNADENEFIRSLLGDFTWIGLSEIEVTGYWQWSDLSLDLRALLETNYTNWETAEPVPNINDKCVQIAHGNGKWDNFDCSATFQYVCKRPEGTCGWGNSIMGAPKPSLVTEIVDGTQIVFSIELGQKVNNSVTYELSFEDIAMDATRCRSGSDLMAGIWNVTRNACSTTVEARLSLADFVTMSNASLSLTPGSNVVDILSTLHIAYYDNIDGSCKMSLFDADISISTILNAESELDFDFTGGRVLNPPTFSALTINGDGKLVFSTRFTPAYDGFRLQDFAFNSHSRGISFDISAVEEDCVGGSACEYTLNVVSTNAETDFSGILYIDFTFVWSTGNTTRSQMSFLLKYDILAEPPVMNNIIQTETSITDALFTQVLNSFTPFERTYILTRTIPTMDVPNVDFSFQNVYICCTRGMMNLPAFNPALNQFGCSVRNDTLMSYWQQLVIDGQANPDMFVQFENLGPLIRSQVALSFDPIHLFGDDKLCYIHSTTQINLNAQAQTVRSSPSSVITSNSLRAVTLQSCSVYATQAQCKTNSLCTWDSNVSGCFNTKDGNHSNSAESMFSVCSFMAFIVLALSTVLLL